MAAMLVNSSTRSKILVYASPLSKKTVEDWADKDAKIPKAKQTRGYSNFIKRYYLKRQCPLMSKDKVRIRFFSLAIKPSNNGCLVWAKSYSSMRKNESPYSVMVSYTSKVWQVQLSVLLALFDEHVLFTGLIIFISPVGRIG